MSAQDYSEYLTTAEAGERLRKSYKTIHRWITIGYRGKRLHAIRVGGNYLTHPQTLEAFRAQIAKL